MPRARAGRGWLSLTVPVETGTPDTILNDGKTGPDGRLYFGTRDLAQRREMGGLYRLDDNLVARRLAGPRHRGQRYRLES